MSNKNIQNNIMKITRKKKTKKQNNIIKIIKINSMNIASNIINLHKEK